MAVAAAAPAAAAQEQGLDRRAISFLAFAHGFNDMNQSVVPAVLPFLIAQRHLSYEAAGMLVLTLTIASSVVQPLFGYLTDRHSIPWLVPGGLLLGMLGTVLLGLAPTYPLLILATLVSGFGSAAFHPEASRYANLVSGSRRGTGMGYFSLGGNAGFAAGPIFVTPALLLFGLHGIGLVMIPGVFYALFLGLFEMQRFATFRKKPRVFASRSERGDRWGPFALLTGAIMLRSMVYFGLLTFTPLFFIAVLGASKGQANAALAITLVVGASGTIFGGRLGDRIDRRWVMCISLGLAAVLAATIGIAGAAQASFVTILFLFLIFAFTTQWSQSVGVVLGQEYLPTRIGTASGVTLGLAISVGGFAAPFLGRLGDTHGLVAVMYAVAGLSLAALAIAAFLPPAGRPPAGHRTLSAQTTATAQS